MGLGLHPIALGADFRRQFHLPRKIRKGILIPRKGSQAQQSAEVDFAREMQTLNKLLNAGGKKKLLPSVPCL